MKKLYFLLIAVLFFMSGKAQIINFPDANFKAVLLTADSTNTIAKNLEDAYFKIDANSDGEIQESEALTVSSLNLSFAFITSLNSIQNFVNLQTLDCENNSLSTLDLSGLNNLQNLWCSNNELSSINTTSLNNLQTLRCDNNQLTSITLNNLNNLNSLSCDWNLLTSLNTSGLNDLQNIHCSHNLLNSLVINDTNSLQVLYCDYNNLTTLIAVDLNSLLYLDCTYNQLNLITLSGTNNLQRLECRNNQLTTLNLNNTSQLEFLGCQNNYLLTSLYIKNEANESLNANHSNNLNFVCADDFQIGAIQSHFGLNCVVSSNCNLSILNETNTKNQVKLYPNPTCNTLNIETKIAIEVKSINIYNTLGQLVLVIPNAQQTKSVDVSSLETGNYFIKINTDKGSSNFRFIKM